MIIKLEYKCLFVFTVPDTPPTSLTLLNKALLAPALLLKFSYLKLFVASVLETTGDILSKSKGWINRAKDMWLFLFYTARKWGFFYTVRKWDLVQYQAFWWKLNKLQTFLFLWNARHPMQLHMTRSDLCTIHSWYLEVNMRAVRLYTAGKIIFFRKKNMVWSFTKTLFPLNFLLYIPKWLLTWLRLLASYRRN